MFEKGSSRSWLTVGFQLINPGKKGLQVQSECLLCNLWCGTSLRLAGYHVWAHGLLYKSETCGWELIDSFTGVKHVSVSWLTHFHECYMLKANSPFLEQLSMWGSMLSILTPNKITCVLPVLFYKNILFSPNHYHQHCRDTVSLDIMFLILKLLLHIISGPIQHDLSSKQMWCDMV